MSYFKVEMTLTWALACMLLCPNVQGGGKVQALGQNPDFTIAGTKPPFDLPENALGTTGAFGWIYHTAKQFSSDGVRQICVVRVAPSTPADGLLQKGDVITGAAGGATPMAFKSNARHEMGMALLDAESEQNQGLLSLTLWRAGRAIEVQLTIPVVKGAYDKDAPVTSERTQAIIVELAAAIQQRGLAPGKWTEVYDALGLLATGNPAYHPTLKTFAESLAIKEPLDLNSREKTAWAWGYKALFLSEYYGVTGDASVLPHLNEYATKLAMGQSYAGTWNHCVANPDMWENGGRLNGRLGGYGAINQTSLSCAIALVVAQKVGVDNKEISAAVERSTEHFLFFVDKGSIPYGDHAPGNSYSANGKNASAAVFLDLVGQTEGASYFSRMTLASFRSREAGHTGHFFSQFWGGLGAACSGDAALNAYTKELQYYLQLERRPGGVCLYQPIMNASWGHYRDWSMNGSRLLQYCAPRKVLYITGKARTTPALEGKELADTVAAGREHGAYNGYTVKDLLDLLGSWSPVVRQRVAGALGTLEESVVPQLIAMLDSDNRYARYGACVALKRAGRASVEGVDALIAKGLQSNDITMRYYAASAFPTPRSWVSGKGWVYPQNGLGEAALRGANPLLKMAATEDPAQDPRNKIHFLLSEWLFYEGRTVGFQGLLSTPKALASADRALLLAATRSILRNQNGRARQMIAKLVYPALTQQERIDLRDDIVAAVREQAPSGIMFSWTVRKEGLSLLAKDQDPEVPELCAHILSNWGKGVFPDDYMKPIATYGSAATVALPGLRQFLADQQQKLERVQEIASGKGRRAEAYRAQLKGKEENVRAIRDLIKIIETAD